MDEREVGLVEANEGSRPVGLLWNVKVKPQEAPVPLVAEGGVVEN